MNDSQPPGYPLRRVPTGIAGLDTILNGGFFGGGLYVLIGVPGVGKTILTNQMGFYHAANGGRVLYVTVLTETHTRLFAHLAAFSFFGRDLVGSRIYYLNGYQAFRDHGLPGLLNLVRPSIRDRQATMMILDGLPLVAHSAATDHLADDFVHDLQAYSEFQQCTSFIVMPSPPDQSYSHAITMADGHLALLNHPVDQRPARSIMVHKMRGTAYLHGAHAFEINASGIVVTPRIAQP